MAAKVVDSVEGLRRDVQEVGAAGSRLLDRLADRAAYAGSDEYREIRSLMTALRVLGERVNTVMARTIGDAGGAGSAESAAGMSVRHGAHPSGQNQGGNDAASA